MAKIEKSRQKYRVALRIAKDPRFEQLPCTHKGTYAVTAACREELSTSVTLWPQLAGTLNAESRKVPGVPITSISNLRHSTERMPDDYGAPRF